MSVATDSHSPAEFLQLLGDPHRWRLLRELTTSDRRVGELSALIGKPQNLVSYHIGQLRQAGLVSSRRSAADGRDTYYRADVARCAEMLAETGIALHPAIALQRAPETPVPPSRFGRPGGRKPRVLFLCTGNSARSQIAEALLEHRSQHTIVARSAGSHPKPLHPDAVRVLRVRGIDISGRTSTPLSRFVDEHFDHVITLCDRVREICPEFPGQPATAHWSMPDPAAAIDGEPAGYDAFERAADEIEGRVALLIAQIAGAATSPEPPQEGAHHAKR